MAGSSGNKKWIGDEYATTYVPSSDFDTNHDHGSNALGLNSLSQGIVAAALEPPPAPSEENQFRPPFDANNFEAGQEIDNPYFPFLTGTIFTSGTLPDEEDPEAEIERDDTFYSYETISIAGVTSLVARDTAYVDGVFHEDTLDFYAQDTQGNVWYMGELSYAFEFDDDGNFLGVSTEGSWTADPSHHVYPGWIMPSPENLADLSLTPDQAYYQEYSPRVAEDQAQVITLDGSAELQAGNIDGALLSLESTATEDYPVEIKTFEPGIGLVLTDEYDESGAVDVSSELLGVRSVGGDIPPDPQLYRDNGDLDLSDFVTFQKTSSLDLPELEDFTEYSEHVYVTYLGGLTDSNNAMGAYTFNIETGVIGDVQILFSSQDDLNIGDQFSIDLDEGEGYGLFLVPDGGELLTLVGHGANEESVSLLSLYEEGGHREGDLSMVNFLSLAEAGGDFDKASPSNINDGLAPLIVDDGDLLPIVAFSAVDVDTTDNYNLLNIDGGVHVAELNVPPSLFAAGEEEQTSILGFEDMFTTDPEFEGDYNDVVVAVSQDQLSMTTIQNVVNNLNLVPDEAVVV